MPKSDDAFDPSTYATVAERITKFYGQYPTGRIITALVSDAGGTVTFRADAYRTVEEPTPAATGWAREREDDGDINAVACLENTETSAIGRALANLGFTASLKRPSREEMEKAERARSRLQKTPSGVHTRAGATSAELQRKADAVMDLHQLVAVATAHGFSPERARIIRTGANRHPALPFARLGRIETAVRAWMRRHEAHDGR